MELFYDILIKCGIVLAVAFTALFVAFIIWNIIYYPYVKKYRLDDEIRNQELRLQELQFEKTSVTEETNKLLGENQKLMKQQNDIKQDTLSLEEEKQKLQAEILELIREKNNTPTEHGKK